LLEKYLEQLRILAQEDANKLTSQVKNGNYTHFFSRLNNILASVGNKNVRQNFSDKIKNECKDGANFQDNLKKIYMGDQKLFDVLTGNSKLPYEGKKFLGDNTEELFGEIGFKISDYNDEICMEYLKNYLRTARKIAALKGGDEND
jgi:hypothetical protein